MTTPAAICLPALPLHQLAPTTSQAIDYTRAFFTSKGLSVTVCGALKHPSEYMVRRVPFDLDGQRYSMDVWIENPLESDAYLYGEW